MVDALVLGVGHTGKIIIDSLIRSKKVDKIYLYNRRKFKIAHMKEELASINPSKEVILNTQIK